MYQLLLMFKREVEQNTIYVNTWRQNFDLNLLKSWTFIEKSFYDIKKKIAEQFKKQFAFFSIESFLFMRIEIVYGGVIKIRTTTAFGDVIIKDEFLLLKLCGKMAVIHNTLKITQMFFFHFVFWFIFSNNWTLKNNECWFVKLKDVIVNSNLDYEDFDFGKSSL